MDAAGSGPLTPLPYHRRVLEYLRIEEPRVFEWFSSERARSEHGEAVRLELLKAAYRLERTSHAALHEEADRAATTLGISAPITIYQSQGVAGLNAYLAYLPGEAHVVLEGPVLDLLSPLQQRALLGHELSHYAFLATEERDMLVAERVLRAMEGDEAAEPSHGHTARLWRLATEILADRGALGATEGDLDAVVGMLVKMTTGLREASAAAYLAQAEEIFSKEQSPAEGLTHPETYLRARALRLWRDEGEACEAEVERMLAGPPDPDTLDLTTQARMTEATRLLIHHLLSAAWLRTDALLAHARAYFPEVVLGGPGAGTEAPAEFRAKGMHRYLCAVLLDFVALAPELEEAPLAAAYAVAEPLGAGTFLLEIAARDLEVPKRQIEQVRTESARILREAGKA